MTDQQPFNTAAIAAGFGEVVAAARAARAEAEPPAEGAPTTAEQFAALFSGEAGTDTSTEEDPQS